MYMFLLNLPRYFYLFEVNLACCYNWCHFDCSLFVNIVQMKMTCRQIIKQLLLSEHALMLA